MFSKKRAHTQPAVRSPAQVHPPADVVAAPPPEPYDVQLDEDEVLIAVMGPTGSGKTTFINSAAQSSLRVGNGLESCTSIVQHSPTFELDGRHVILIDTPGFDDTHKGNTDILRMIALYLSTTYENGKTLAGILYFHRISDFRMGGMSRKNFEIFRSLCGDDYLKNTFIVTNMWGQVDPEVGLSRETELVTKDAFLKTAIDKGARVLRNEDTVQSAHNIIRQVFKNRPAPLRIQVELVDEKKQLPDTLAGSVLTKELQELAEKHRQQMEELTNAMEEAIKEKDEESRRELEEEAMKLQEEMDRVKKETDEMAAQYAAEKAKLAAFVVAKEVAEVERRRADRQVEQLSQRIEILDRAVRHGERTTRGPTQFEPPPQRVGSRDHVVRQEQRTASSPAQFVQPPQRIERSDRHREWPEPQVDRRPRMGRFERMGRYFDSFFSG